MLGVDILHCTASYMQGTHAVLCESLTQCWQGLSRITRSWLDSLTSSQSLVSKHGHEVHDSAASKLEINYRLAIHSFQKVWEEVDFVIRYVTILDQLDDLRIIYGLFAKRYFTISSISKKALHSGSVLKAIWK